MTDELSNASQPSPDPEPPLHRAARTGDHAEIRRLVASGTDIDSHYDFKNRWDAIFPLTPLMVAAASNDGATAETIRLLLELGANPQHDATIPSVIAMTCGGYINSPYTHGDAPRLKVLLDAGAPLPSDPEFANRVLCTVASRGDAEQLRILIDHGLNPRGYFNAEEARREELERLAHDAEAPDPFEQLLKDQPEHIREYFLASSSSEYTIDEREIAPFHACIPLFCAALSGNLECVRILIEAGADLHVRDNAYQTAIFYAGSTEVARTLKDHGLSLEDGNLYKWTPLIAAFYQDENTTRVVRSLIEAGASVNAPLDGTPIFLRAVGGFGRSVESLRLLVEAGADPKFITSEGSNAFRYAINVNGIANLESSVRETLSYLKELGVDINHCSAHCTSPLAYAIDSGTGIEVQVLCELGADPRESSPLRFSFVDSSRGTPLPLIFHACRAATYSNLKTLSLLKAGADPLVTTAEGHTPLVLALADFCSHAGDYEENFSRFFRELRTLQLPSQATTTDREQFVRERILPIREFAQRFASTIPNERYPYGTSKREVWCDVITYLLAYESWYRHATQPREGDAPS